MAVRFTPRRDVMLTWIYTIVLVCDVTEALKNGRGRPQFDPDDIDIHIGREPKPEENSRKLVITTVLDAPYMMMKPYSMGSFIAGNDLYQGYMADIMKNLSQSIGFTYVIRLALDGKYGEADLDGNWNGMIGELQRGEADIAIGPIVVTPERKEVVDFTNPIMRFRSTALLKTPRKSGKRYPIMTSEDLLQSDVIYGVIDGSILQRVMRTSSDPLYRAMWARMANFWPTPAVHSVQEGIERTRRDNYGFIVDTPLSEYLIGQEPCDLYAIEPFLKTRTYAIAIRKNDELINDINTQLQMMHERQILSEFYLKWWHSTCDLYIPRNDHWQQETTASSMDPPNEQGQVAHRESSATLNNGNTKLVLIFSFVTFSLQYFFFFHHITRRILLVGT